MLLVPTGLLALITGFLPAQEVFEAAKKNDLAKVEALARKDPSLLRSKDSAGDSLLHRAGADGSVALAGLLLSLGADINAVNSRLETPLHAAINNKKDDVATLLIDRGADLSRKDNSGYTPLHSAVQRDRTAIVKRLLASGVEIDSRNDDGATPFMRAARFTGNVEIGKLLLSHGAAINTRDSSAYMPLNWAAFFGKREFVEFLLDNGATYDATEGKGLLILRSAAQYGCERLFKVVADREKGLFNYEKENTTTMSRAILGGSVEIVKLLQARGIPLPHANFQGWLPIHEAVRSGHLAMIEFLVEQGADIKARTPAGKSPYNIADGSGDTEAKALILKLGGNADPQRFPELRGSFIGMEPPGKQPKVFAPDIVLPSHSSVTSTPDGKEFYWQSAKQTIWTTRWDKDGWKRPEAVPFSQAVERQYRDDVPFVAPDGKRMFFTSTRPISGVEPGKENIWYVERASEGWANPKPVSAEVNSLTLHWQVSVAASGTLYFAGTGPECYGSMDVYSSRLVNGSYQKPVNLGPVINGQGNDAFPFIAPDESYLIFGKDSSVNSAYFSISFRGPQGQWLPPIRLSQEWKGYCPVVSPDGKYLFYLGQAEVAAIFWINAGFIRELRPVGK